MPSPLPLTRARNDSTITQDIEYITRLGGDGQRVNLATYEPDEHGLIPFTQLVVDRFNYPTMWGCMSSAISTAVGGRTFCSPVDYLTGQVKLQMDSLREYLEKKTSKTSYNKHNSLFTLN